jgi:cell division protein FtsI/penicillin-binding protein 2
MLQSVTDIRDVPLTIGDKNIHQPARNGDDIVLTIDRNIQAKVEEVLAKTLQRTGADDASIIVMDPRNAHVLAMANLPDYLPAEFNRVADATVFNNATISRPYEPASIIKLFTYSLGIEKGVVKPTDTYINTDSIRVDDYVISNAARGHTGQISFQHALNYSLNTATVTVFQRLGDGSTINRSARNVIYDFFYNHLRFGQKTDIELFGEAAGTVISPESSEGNAVRYSNMSFGQGLYPTMIQVVAGFSAIVNGGTYHSPTIVAGVMEGAEFKPDDERSGTRIVSKSTADTVKEMARSGRAAFYSHLDKRGYVVGGKTGTAEVVRDGRYTKDETVASYLGFGGNDESQYVIIVRVAGKGKKMQGARDALPVFTEVSNWLIDYLRIEPKG